MKPLPLPSLGRPFLAAIALGLAFARPETALSQAPTSGPLKVERAVEVVARWTPDQHLYVKGDLGLAPDKLEGLETWLDTQAPHWTVVLARDAVGESFLDDNGRVLSGMDAVDHALGKSLANTTTFGELTDGRTGERNGAFFILYLKERKFTYYASDVYDQRRLGEARWIGKLDQPAVRAMRGGGRIIDAVKDTITNIESQLTRQIEAEKAAARLASARRQEAQAENRAQIQALRTEIDDIEESVAAYRTTHPEASGDLVKPETAAWKSALSGAELHTEEGQVDGPAGIIRRTRETIAGFREAFERLAKAPAEADQLEKRLASLGSIPAETPADGWRTQAQEALKSARDNAARADSLYLTQLGSGQAAVDAAERAILSWRQEIEAERARRRQLTGFLWSLLGLAFVASGIGLVVANRLRRPAKAEAEKALARWRDQLGCRFDTLFQLMDRTRLVIGSGTQLDARGYTGTTLHLGKEAVRLVDELFIMSSAADKVMGLATSAIEPRGLAGRVVNAISSRRYRRGLRYLESEAIGFDPKEGLEAILRTGDERKPRLLGDAADYEPFQLTFSELISAYDAKQTAATVSLDRLQSCIDDLPVRLEAVRLRLAELVARSLALDRDSQLDGHFPIAASLGTLTDAIGTSLDEASTRGKTDPVTAHEGPAAQADRLSSEGLRLADRVASWRTDEKAGIEEAIEMLQRHDRRTRWIADAYAELSEMAQRAIDAILAGPAETALEAFDADLVIARERLADIVLLSRRATESSRSAIESGEAAIGHARTELSATLGCDPGALFEEPEHRPADHVAEARRDFEASLMALDRGHVADARNRLDEIDAGLDLVESILERSKTIFTTFGDQEGEISLQASQYEAEISKAADRVNALRHDYDSRVLRFGSRHPKTAENATDDATTGVSSSEGQRTLDDALSDGRQFISRGQADLTAARAAREALRPIEAARCLDRAIACLSDAATEVAEINAHADALLQAVATNPEVWKTTSSRHQNLATDMADPRTQRRTIEEWESAKQELASISSKMEDHHPNPFAIQAALESLADRLIALAEEVVSDWDLHTSATTALSLAAEQIGKLESRVKVSQTDSIPDSAGVLAAQADYATSRDRLAAMDVRRSEPHGDWVALEREAAAIASDALVILSGLNQELERGKACAIALNRAAASLHAVRDWRGGHQVTLDRSAGLDIYRLAYAAFSAGDYDTASQQAAQAHDAASRALQRAKFDYQRAVDRIRDEERQAERHRRSSSLSFSDSSSFGPSSSHGGRSSSRGGGSSSRRCRSSSRGGGSSSDGGGSSSRSSFSSGSGTSRSGW
ncbi:MAG: hypothetical protein JNK37_23150 [Verrucomicrobiales bacterium]|nr:hypothetical protein [Verrucomicrobiales bacterium]